MENFTGDLVGGAISAFAGIFIALLTIRLQRSETIEAEKRGAVQRANVVRNSLASEIEVLLQMTKVIVEWDKGPIPEASAMSSLGALKIQVYPGLVPELGVLDADLVPQVIAFYAHVDHLIERGREIERDYGIPDKRKWLDHDSGEYLEQYRKMYPGYANMAAAIRNGIGSS